MSEKTDLKKWYEKEQAIYLNMVTAAAVLMASMFIEPTKLQGFTILGAPFNLGVTISLFIVNYIFLTVFHWTEFRLSHFYAVSWNGLSSSQKSLDDIITELYLHSFIFLSMFIIHYYLFALALLAFSFLDLIFSFLYLKEQRKRERKCELDWALGVFDPAALFKRWYILDLVRIAIVAVGIFWVWCSKGNYLFAAHATAILLVAECVVDCFWNRKFYFNYYPPKIIKRKLGAMGSPR